MNELNKICIAGAGGFARETLMYLMEDTRFSDKEIFDYAVFMVDDNYYKEDIIMGIPVIKRSEFQSELYEVVVAIGNSVVRKDFVEKLPNNISFTKIIHKSSLVSKWVELGAGTIVAPNSIFTCNIRIGLHAHININSTIGHDCIIGDYFTTAPGVNISGNCIIGDCVYIGSNASIREKISICDNVTIGMGSVIVKNINEAGIYVGNPAKKIGI